MAAVCMCVNEVRRRQVSLRCTVSTLERVRRHGMVCTPYDIYHSLIKVPVKMSSVCIQREGSTLTPTCVFSILDRNITTPISLFHRRIAGLSHQKYIGSSSSQGIAIANLASVFNRHRMKLDAVYSPSTKSEIDVIK